MRFSNIHIKILALAFALAALLCLWQRSEISGLRAELAAMETAFAKAQVSALRANLEAADAVFAVRDKNYADIKEASLYAVTQIATAIPGNGEADVDRPLPRSLSDALVLQSAGVRSGSGGDSPSGSPVRPQSAPGSSRGAGAGDDGAADGGMALPVHSLGR